jgi:hypothetical protein
MTVITDRQQYLDANFAVKLKKISMANTCFADFSSSNSK